MQTSYLSEWHMGKLIFCQRDAAKDRTVDNFWPISCVLLMYKLLTSMNAEEMYGFLENEQTAWKDYRRTNGLFKVGLWNKGQTIVQQKVLKDCKRRKTNIAMAWNDYKKVYKKVSHSWNIESFKMFWIAEYIKIFIIEL